MHEGISQERAGKLTSLTTSLNYYQILSEDLTENLEEITTSLITVPNQPDSLAAVVLQNRRGLDLLIAEKRRPMPIFGGSLLFLHR